MKLMVGLDGSSASKYALETAYEYAKAFGADIVAFAAAESDVMTREESIEKAEQSLQYAVEFLQDKGVACETQLSVRGYKPGKDIVAYARENNIDAIFIGVKRRSKIEDLLFGSNASYIIQNAPCPVTSVL